MNLKVVLSDFSASMKNFIRNKGTIFFTLAFPIILMLLFGAIFSGGGGSYSLYVANYDYDNGDINATMLQNNSQFEKLLGNYSNFYDAIYGSMKDTDILKIKLINTTKYDNLDKLGNYIKKEKLNAVMVIPDGYITKLGAAILFKNVNLSENITLMLDQSDTQSNGIIMSVVMQFVNQGNLIIAGGNNFIQFNTSSTLSGDIPYIVFFIPAIIGLTVMTTSIFGTVETNTRFKKNGILRKLSTTPLKRSEWILAKMLFMLFISFLSISLILVIGVTVIPVLFGVNVTFKLNIFLFTIIISTSFAFSGMGMILGRYVKDEDTVPVAANLLTFPQMFLAGTFIPINAMPAFLQVVAKFLPLYYVNEGLRDSMIYGDTASSFINTIIIFTFAMIVFAAGVAVTRWKED